MVEKKQKEAQLSLKHLRILFAAMAVSEDILRRANNLLDDITFPTHYAPYRLWYTAVRDEWKESEEMPELGILKGVLNAHLSENASDDEEISEISEIFAFAKHLKSKVEIDKVTALADKALTVFVEILVREDMSFQMQHAPLDDVLSKAKASLVRARATADDQFANPLARAGQVTEEESFYIPTGHALYDLYCGGKGPAVGNKIGHGAVRGGGKTTFATQLASMLASAERQQCGVKPPKIVYIFNYENVQDVLTQCLTFTANIDRDKVDDYIIQGRVSQFSRKLNYTKDELRQFARRIRLAAKKKDNSLLPNAEYERLKEAQKQHQVNLQIVDFGLHNEINAKYSSNYIDGIHQYIEDHQHKLGHPGVKAIFIDYVGTAVKRYMRTLARTNPDTERSLIEEGPLMSDKLAWDFRTFVHLAQQLSGEQASLTEGSRPDANAFKGCKSFPENCDYCMVSGVPIKKNGLTIWVHSKHRRGEGKPDQIAQLDGNRSRWLLIDSDYTIKGNKIVSTVDIHEQEEKQKEQYDLDKALFEDD